MVAEQQQQSASSMSELEDGLEDSESEEDESEILEPPSPGALADNPLLGIASFAPLGKSPSLKSNASLCLSVRSRWHKRRLRAMILPAHTTGLSVDVGADNAPFNVLLTTYSLFERDSEENKLDRAFLKLWSWSCLLLDEAHAVKNRSAKRTTHLNRLSSC